MRVEMYMLKANSIISSTARMPSRLAASGARHAKKVIDSKVRVEWIVD